MLPVLLSWGEGGGSTVFACALVCEEYNTVFKYYFLNFHVHILLIYTINKMCTWKFKQHGVLTLAGEILRYKNDCSSYYDGAVDRTKDVYWTLFAAPEVVVKEKAMLASDVWGVGTLTFLL